MTNYSERKVLNNFLIAFVKQKDNLHIYIMNIIPSNILAHIYSEPRPGFTLFVIIYAIDDII